MAPYNLGPRGARLGSVALTLRSLRPAPNMQHTRCMLVPPAAHAVSADRRGEVLREGFCAGVGKVESTGADAAVTLRSLATSLNVTLDELIRVNRWAVGRTRMTGRAG